MLPRNHLDCIQIAFDDHRLVANVGPLLPATLGPAPRPFPTGTAAPGPERCPWPGQHRQQTDDAGGLRPGRRRLHRRRRWPPPWPAATASTTPTCCAPAGRPRSRLRAQGAIHPGNLPAQLPADRSLSQGRPLLMAVRGVSPTSVISWPEARKQPIFQAALSSASGVVSHPAARRACSRSKAERME